MGVEIERKFIPDLSNQELLQLIEDGTTERRMTQGYFTHPDNRTSIRVRIVESDGNRKAYITIKSSSGLERDEFEYKIPVVDSSELFKLTCGTVIHKLVKYFQYGGLEWRFDLFTNENSGLVLLEVEMPTKDCALELPKWVAYEVTSNERYYNKYLSFHPFEKWASSHRKNIRKLIEGKSISGRL